MVRNNIFSGSKNIFLEYEIKDQKNNITYNKLNKFQSSFQTLAWPCLTTSQHKNSNFSFPFVLPSTHRIVSATYVHTLMRKIKVKTKENYL